MPFARMNDALNTAQNGGSDPVQFSLSQDDFNAFEKTLNQNKSSGALNGQWTYRSIPVVAATDAETPSRLHLLDKDGALPTPIPV